MAKTTQAKNGKKFLASWSGEYYTKAKAGTRALSFFSEDNGYDKDDISKIKKLKVGDSAEIDKGHIVVRTK